MKKLLSATVASVAIASSASAADIAARSYIKSPPVLNAVYDWSGFYIGANGGWGSSRKCLDLNQNGNLLINPIIAEGCHDATSGVAGGQIGYRWQSAAWVFGLEAQGDWAHLKGSNQSLAFGAVRNNSKVDAFGLFTGQIGYAWNNALLYVKGGAAVTSDKYRGTSTVAFGGLGPFPPFAAGALIDTGSETRWGSTVGVGIEYGFAPSWSAAIEYDHLFMGNHNVAMTASGATAPAGALSRIDNIRQDADLITVRVNYRFGGPLVAKF